MSPIVHLCNRHSPMPLVLLCGQPCSGKSTVAQLVAVHLRSLTLEVVVIDEDSLGLERSVAYKDATSEKQTRGLLKSAVQRELRGERVVILDSLNNIKGFRYELWCIARAAATRYCVIQCELSAETCRAWNSQRSSPSYSAKVFEDLASRFEPPDTRNRWDTPLIRVNPHADQLSDKLQPAIAAVTGQPSSGQSSHVPQAALKMTTAAANSEASTTNLLSELDRTAQEVVTAIIDAQAQVGGEAAGTVQIPGLEVGLQLRRAINLPELRRHKRSFLRLATQLEWTRVRDAIEARRLFVDYLQSNIEQ